MSTALSAPISFPCWLTSDDLLLLVIDALKFAGDKINLASLTKSVSQTLEPYVKEVLLLPKEAAEELGVSLRSTRVVLSGGVTAAACNYVRQSSMLQHLELTQRSVRAEAVKHLALAIADSASLTSLILSENYIKGSGEALGKALNANSSLKELRMHRCGIDAEDGKGIAVHASSLTSADFSCNQIDPEGAKLLASALTTNASLTEAHSTFRCMPLPGSYGSHPSACVMSR